MRDLIKTRRLQRFRNHDILQRNIVCIHTSDIYRNFKIHCRTTVLTNEKEASSCTVEEIQSRKKTVEFPKIQYTV